ncbi:hypothetical protein [Promicromonospora sp. NPDC057488]|uniref:hypothetical protein n=1 Tax=Promicromonospora sp. NPDC057488 TaxID=3346147 RepID=UPI003671BF32
MVVDMALAVGAAYGTWLLLWYMEPLAVNVVLIVVVLLVVGVPVWGGIVVSRRVGLARDTAIVVSLLGPLGVGLFFLALTTIGAGIAVLRAWPVILAVLVASAGGVALATRPRKTVVAEADVD